MYAHYSTSPVRENVLLTSLFVCGNNFYLKFKFFNYLKDVNLIMAMDAAKSEVELSRIEHFNAKPLNNNPIIGILALDKSYKIEEKFPGHESYIAASYVKFVEGGGARVVPVW